jgi:hypothetical protein
MEETSGQVILGIGVILLSVSAPICMVLLKTILSNSTIQKTEMMARTECEAWRQGLAVQIVSLRANVEELFRKLDNLNGRSS